MVDDLKKGRQKFWLMKMECFSGKGKICEIFVTSENFLKIGGNLKQGGNASWPQGDGRSWKQQRNRKTSSRMHFRNPYNKIVQAKNSFRPTKR